MNALGWLWGALCEGRRLTLPLRHVCFVCHLLRSTDCVKISRREEETGTRGNRLIICQVTTVSNCFTVNVTQLDSTWLKYVFKLKWSDLDDVGVPPGNSKSMPSFPLPSEATCQFHERAATCCSPVAFWRFWQRFTTTIATFRDALGCCSWEQCWMNLLEHEPQKYDRQWVEVTEPFAWRKWRKNVRKTKAATTYI